MVSLLSAKHLRPVDSRGEAINKGMKFVDIFALWLISLIPTLPRVHIGPTELSQALCVSDQIEETREDNVRYYARLLGATFCSGPPGVWGLVLPPLQISQTWLSAWLWLTVGTVAAFSPVPACLGLQTAGSDLLAQFPARQGGTRLGTEVERLEWGQRRGRGRGGGAHLNRYFLSLLPLPTFSPYYQSVWCQTCPIWGERRDAKCRQILRVAADYLKRRKYRLLLWGLLLITLSAAGEVKEGTQVLLFEKIQTSYVFIWPPSLWETL